MRNGLSIKCNKRGKRGTEPGRIERGNGQDEFDGGDIHGKCEEGRGDVSQHSQSYKFQEPSLLYLGRLGTCDGKVREGGLKLLTRHEVGSFIIMHCGSGFRIPGLPVPFAEMKG